MPDIHLLDSEEDLAPPISSTPPPARSHAASLWPWPCSFTKSAMSPVLQAHESWADHVNSSAGELPCLLLGSGGALRPDTQRRRSYMRVFTRPCAHAGYGSTCPEAPASDCLAEAAGSLCCRSRRNDHVSAGCTAALELSSFFS